MIERRSFGYETWSFTRTFDSPVVPEWPALASSKPHRGLAIWSTVVQTNLSWW